jgi:hypothetical protein
MLPASFQAPAAIILVLGGLLACVAGYRVFRVVLGIYGFILGALVASSAMGADQTWYMVAAAIVGGLIGAVILILAYFVGVALIGGALGALVANVVWALFSREPGLIVVIVFAIVGALGALALQRYVIIVATAYGGAQTAVVGAAALLANRTVDAASHSVYRVYPIDPMPGTRMDLVAWIVLGTLGLAVQLRMTKTRGAKGG